MERLSSRSHHPACVTDFWKIAVFNGEISGDIRERKSRVQAELTQLLIMGGLSLRS